MKPLIVVQNNFVVRVTAEAAIAARALNLDIHDLSAGTIGKHTPLPTSGDWHPLLVIGAVPFLREWVGQDDALSRWIFWDDAQFDAAVWAKTLGSIFLNYDGISTTVADFIASDSQPMHIRPRSALKLLTDCAPTESKEGPSSIPGLVASPADLVEYNIERDALIWAAPPKLIDAEVRIWVVAGEVATASTYRIGGEHHRSRKHPLVNAAKRAAEDYVKIWSPARHYVIDLALSDGWWKVIEYNPIHCSGWYDADPAAFIKAYMAAER